MDTPGMTSNLETSLIMNSIERLYIESEHVPLFTEPDLDAAIGRSIGYQYIAI